MASAGRLACFTAYDIRGRVPDELDADLAYRIGCAFVDVTSAKQVVLGRDARLTGPNITNALAAGLSESGADVLDIGLSGTEEIYFTTGHFALGGGIAVTASHNPADCNGMKLVRDGARPISSDSGLSEIERLSRISTACAPTAPRITPTPFEHREAYVKHMISQIDVTQLRPLKIVCNAGNGPAGALVDALAEHLPFELVRLQWQPDGTFPNGIPNPLLPECRDITRNAVIESGAHLGIAWDGDFDRCFFFDASGRFIEGYYVVGLLAASMLAKNPGEKIIHDPRLTWNTIDVVTNGGGIPVISKTGHAFIKERMRVENAIYGGEMSAHHYFRDFFYCDSGMLPWLLVVELMSRRDTSLAELVNASMAAFPCSGEINFRVHNAPQILKALQQRYASNGQIDYTDGISIDLDDWRFNVRTSNTEPLLRLNVESRGDALLMQTRTEEISAFIQELNVTRPAPFRS